MSPISLDRWKGKVAIVTGASAGIGAAIAEQLVEQGLQVVGLARRVERVEELAKKLKGKKGKLHGVKADISKEEDILNAFKWTSDNLGPVHILVNNAGLTQKTNLTTEGDTEKWRKIFDTNVMGLCIATREAVKIMQAKKIDGHVIHINSTTGHRVPNLPGRNVYPASKHCVTALTETLRHELRHLGLKVKITSVSPGRCATEFGNVTDPKILEQMKNVPRLKPENVANAVLYVLSTPPDVQVPELTIQAMGDEF
ncbi:farnesol dehydrogenase-like [Tenebrio molitor]|jgi:NADP+-dependent farnesol dehydrogenase|uniref:farnesol dehydrogenase-like n=1 Tax=Tenebrio molitor TaxID=7067 RepID=UPI0036246BC6